MKTKGKFINYLCCSAILGVAATIAAPQAIADIPVDLFEMDGNTVKNTNPDWEDPGNDTVFGFVTDTTDRTFKKGSKDTQDVSQWNWDFFNTVTPKDDIQHAYAAYLKDGDDYLYFGLDRLGGSSSGGTTSFGFWAFQDKVSLEDPDRITSDEFLGEHKQGDIFIAGDMAGNRIDELRVYIWAGGDGTAGHLEEITDQANIIPDCTDSQNGNQFETDACGEINEVPIDLDWDGTIEEGRFLEVVLNYTELVGPLPCFNTFMATTRTSDSEKASTKNFASGGFPVCSIDVTKTCSTVALVDPFGNADNGYMPIYRTEFLATVINDGAAKFSSTATVTVTDAAGTVFDDGNDITVSRTVSDLSGSGAHAGDVGSDGFDPGEYLDVPDTGLTITGSYLTTSNGGQNKVKAKIVDGLLEVSSDVYIEDCNSLSLTPALYIEKDCDDVTLTTKDLQGGDLGQVGITVGYDIRACNTGEYALDVDLYDPTVGLNTTDIILANGVACDTNADCPATSSCVGADSPDPGVCVYNASDVNGPDPLDPTNDTKSVAVCSRTNGDYLLTGLTGGASSATPFDAIFSNTAKVSASTADNPLLSTNIMETDTADCPLCDSDEDHVPDYTDPDPQDPNVPVQQSQLLLNPQKEEEKDDAVMASSFLY